MVRNKDTDCEVIHPEVVEKVRHNMPDEQILNKVSAGIVICFTILPRFRLTTQVARSDSDANTTVLSVSVIVKGR